MELFLIKLIKPQLASDIKSISRRVDLLEGEQNILQDIVEETPPPQQPTKPKENTEKKTKSSSKAPKKDLENFDVYWPKILQEGKNILTPRKYSYLTLVSPQIEDNENLTLYVDDENEYLITELKKSYDILEFIESEIAKIMGLKVSIQVKAAKGLSENSSLNNNVQENINSVFDIENID